MNQDKLSKYTIAGGCVVLGAYLLMRGLFAAVRKEPVLPETKDELINESLNVAMASVGGALFVFAMHFPSLSACRRSWLD